MSKRAAAGIVLVLGLSGCGAGSGGADECATEGCAETEHAPDGHDDGGHDGAGPGGGGADGADDGAGPGPGDDDDGRGDDDGPAVDDTGGDEGPDPDCGATPPTVTGTITTSVAGVLEFDHVEVSIGHKQDIDPIEDGCINAASFEFQNGDGCRLTVLAGETIDGDRLEVDLVELTADSQCVGFLDHQEGHYSGSGAASNLELSQLDIAEVNVATSCFAGALTLHLSAVLDGPSPLTIEGTVVADGDFVTTAVDAPCPMGSMPGDDDDDDDTPGPVCDAYPAGGYTPCYTEGGGPVRFCGLDPLPGGSGTSICIIPTKEATHSVCGVDGCEDECDCFAPPASGTAPVVCGPAWEDGGNVCHLSCGGGEACPVGMQCVEGVCYVPN